MLHIRAASHPAVPPVSMPIVCAAMASPLKMTPTNGALAAASKPIAIGSITFATLLSLAASERASYISSFMFWTTFMPRACQTACASAAESAAFWSRIFALESCAVFHVIVSIPMTTKMTSATTTPTLPRSEASRPERVSKSIFSTFNFSTFQPQSINNQLPTNLTSISTRLPNIPGGPCR